MLDLIANYKIDKTKNKNKTGIQLKAAQYYSEWTAEQWFEQRALGGETS